MVDTERNEGVLAREVIDAARERKETSSCWDRVRVVGTAVRQPKSEVNFFVLEADWGGRTRRFLSGAPAAHHELRRFKDAQETAAEAQTGDRESRG